jgi:hypothetical protein
MPGSRRAPQRAQPYEPIAEPEVRLGALVEGGLAPALFAVIERGVRRRPELARGLRAEVELSTGGTYPPVRVLFRESSVLVEDGAALAPDLRIIGPLEDLVSLMVAPLVRGVPSPIRPRGRAALGLLAQRRVRFHGPLALTRRFLRLIRI